MRDRPKYNRPLNISRCDVDTRSHAIRGGKTLAARFARRKASLKRQLSFFLARMNQMASPQGKPTLLRGEKNGIKG